MSSASRPVTEPIACLRRGRSNISAIAALVFLIATSYRVFSQQAQPESEATETVQGTVINQATGDGIGRALVFSPDNRYRDAIRRTGPFRIHGSEPKENSDANGRFLFGKRPAVIMTGRRFLGFSARKPGFLENSDPAGMAEHGTEMTIRLVPEAIIKGRVVVSDAEAAAGINIELYAREVLDGTPRWTRSQNAIANSNGEFRFADLKPGTYKIMTHEMLDTDPAVMAPVRRFMDFLPSVFRALEISRRAHLFNWLPARYFRQTSR